MTPSKRITALTFALLSSSALLALPSYAQNRAGTGLDSLDEARVRETLAANGMEDLLTRSFTVGNTPQAEQDSIRSLISFNRLVNQDVDKLNARQRKEIVASVTGGIDKAIGNMKDPKSLMNLAGKLYKIGVANETTLLEYWGEDTATQARMHPAAEALLKIYTKAEAAANDKMNAVANSIKSADDPRLDDLTKLQTLVTTVQYTKMSSEYFAAISLDKADPRRKTLADETIEYLKQFDDPTSTIQPTVKNQIGKLLIAKGDYDGAIAMFKSLYTDPSKLTPAPSAFDQNDARFFTAVAQLLAKKPDDAEKQLKETATWQGANFPSKGDLQIVSDADEVLKARIAWQRSEAATSPADKTKFDDAASTTLTALMKSNPGLKPLILEQLANRLPAGADLKKLDPLLLLSLIDRAKTEYAKDKKEPFDKPTVEKGIAAAKEILSRKGQPSVDKDAIDTALTVTPFFAQKLDQPKVAAAAFLDYAQAKQDPAKNEKADDAWAQAMNIIVGQFKAPNTSDPDVSTLYDRAVPMGIKPPFNHKELAYAWGRRIQSLLGADESKAVAKNDEVIKYYSMVPDTAPESLNAKYWLSVALSTKLDKDAKLSAAGKADALKQIQTLSDQITTGAKDAMAKTDDAKKKNVYRQMLVRTPLLAAGLAQGQQKDPKRALQILEGYEQTVQGLPNADQLLSDALQTRVFAYMDLGENVKATDALVDLLQKRGANEGIKVVYDLLQRLNKEIDAAFAKGDQAKVKELAPNRAVLTGFLAKWASTNKDPKVQEMAYGYQAFDADSKRLAASLESDPAKRNKLLDDTLKAYETLLAQPKGAADPNVQFGSALTYYDLANYEKSRDGLLKLLRDRRLGQAKMEITTNGQTTLQDNDNYWEARLKLLRSNLEIARKASDQATTDSIKGELRLIYTQFGKTTGGVKWGPEFEKLRLEIDPSINPDEAIVPETTQPSTEQSVP